MKVAYLITVHQHPRLLARAVTTLSNPDAGFFVHLDRKSDLEVFAPVAGSRVVFVDRLAVHWGEFSQVAATMHLIERGLASRPRYDYFVFLQGSDYPLRSGRYIQSFLDAHRGSEFINLRRMPAPGYPLAKLTTIRYPSHAPLRRFAFRALAKAGLARRDYSAHLPGFAPFAGQAYWALSRSACQYILDVAARTPSLERFFRHAFTADEMFIHTILGNSDFLGRTRPSLMFVTPSWSVAGDTRHQVSDDDVRFFRGGDRIVLDNEWGAGEVLFARKFSDARLHLVDEIDAMITDHDVRYSALYTLP